MSQLGLPMADDGHGRRHPGPRRGRGGGHRTVVAVLLSLLVVAGLVVAVVVGGRAAIDALSGLGERAAEDYAGPGVEDVTVIIEPGDSVRAIGARLEEAGVVASAAAFVDAAVAEPRSTGIQPGSYSLRTRSPAADALAVLVDPDRRLVAKVTLPEGLRLSLALARAAEQAGFALPELEAAAADRAALGLPAYAPGLEGFLFPATYEVEPGSAPADLLSAAVVRANAALQAVGLEARAAQLGLTPLQVVTVASLVEAEARHAEDRPKVARVIYNRLAKGMALQLDSTVHYALNESGNVFTTDEQRQVDSPYNTYRYPGLPPGPVNSPGEAALEAALAPAPGTWEFFVTVNLDTGETRFSDALAEHEANRALLTQFCAGSDLC